MAILVDIDLVEASGERAVYDIGSPGGTPTRVTLLWRGEDEEVGAQPPPDTWTHAVRHAVSKIIGRRLDTGEWPASFGSAA